MADVRGGVCVRAKPHGGWRCVFAQKQGASCAHPATPLARSVNVGTESGAVR